MQGMHAADTIQPRSGAAFAALLGWVAGTALQLQQTQLWSAWSYALALLLGATLAGACMVWPSARARLPQALLAGALIAFAVVGLRATVLEARALDPALEGRDLQVTGVVAGLPQQGSMGLRFVFAVESATLDGEAQTVPDRIDVGWFDAAALAGDATPPQRSVPALRAGERWRFTLRLKAPHGLRNPHGFDYELWLWERGVRALGTVRSSARDPAPQRLNQTARYPVAQARQGVRERIYQRLGDDPRAGVLAALVLGDQSAIDRADWDVFRATGVAHLVAISGLHIGLFAWVAMGLAGCAWRRSAWLCLRWPAPQVALAAGLLAGLGYAVFFVWGVPAQRCCVMLATVLVLRLCGARWPWPQVLLLACALVVAWDPWALLQPGFWLSFFAVGLLFAINTEATHSYSTRLGALKQAFIATLRQQALLSAGLAPLTLLLFGQVSLVSALANLLAIPWVTLVVTPLALGGVLLAPLCDGASACLAWLITWLQWLASAPWSLLTLPRAPLWLGLGGVLRAVCLLLPWPWQLRLLGAPPVLALLLWRPEAPPPGAFSLLAADVGQGNAVLVQTAHHALLYDAGPRYSRESDAGQRVLTVLMQALDVRLDTVLLSHSDSDHVGGAAAVLATQPQAELLSSLAATHPLRSGRDSSRCEAGQSWHWDGVDFSILHPQPQDYERRSQPNALSCVLRVSNGAQTALLVGDIERAQEARLVAQAAPLKADVLLVPHHGSKTSSSAAFLDAVQPALALVQAGYRNRFGHPAPTVLARYSERGVVVQASPHCGALQWLSWQAATYRCTRTHARRYWQHAVP